MSLFHRLRQRLRAHLPTAEQLQRHRWLQPIAHRIGERDLWRLRSESVARGVAVGMLWAFITPVAQILFAVAHCVWWRGNIPVAAAVTLITNPFTLGGWLYLAYQTGVAIIGPVALPFGTGWLASFGLPTVVGLALFGVGGAIVSYLVVSGAARLWRAWRLTRRRFRR